MSKLKFIAIIPARYASTRFPAKPLAMLGGKQVIERVYEQVSDVVERVIVATDDERIKALMFGIKHRLARLFGLKRAKTLVSLDFAFDFMTILLKLFVCKVISFLFTIVHNMQRRAQPAQSTLTNKLRSNMGQSRHNQ